MLIGSVPEGDPIETLKRLLDVVQNPAKHEDKIKALEAASDAAKAAEVKAQEAQKRADELLEMTRVELRKLDEAKAQFSQDAAKLEAAKVEFEGQKKINADSYSQGWQRFDAAKRQLDRDLEAYNLQVAHLAERENAVKEKETAAAEYEKRANEHLEQATAAKDEHEAKLSTLKSVLANAQGALSNIQPGG